MTFDEISDICFEGIIDGSLTVSGLTVKSEIGKPLLVMPIAI